MAAVVSFHSACRFFSHYAWDTDRLGLPGARLIVDRLLDTDAPIEVAVDDTLFRRWEKRVHNAFWTHDDTAQGPAKLGRGNRWVIVGIVVRLPFCSHPVCLPILFRLWGGKDTASPTELDGAMLEVLAEAFPHKNIHAVGDAAYHRRPLLSPGTTITTGLPANAVLHRLAPPRTGRRGRPAKPATAGRGTHRAGFLVQTLVIVWYTTRGYHPDDLTSRHACQPWYDQKTEPAFEDMLAKLRLPACFPLCGQLNWANAVWAS